MLEAIYKKGAVFKYPNVFQCDNGFVFEKLKFEKQQQNIFTITQHVWESLTNVWKNSYLSPWMLMSIRTLVLKSSAPYKNHLCAEEFNVVFVYGTYILDGETSAKLFFKQDMEFTAGCGRLFT